jgi:hypothetical protein
MGGICISEAAEPSVGERNLQFRFGCQKNCNHAQPGSLKAADLNEFQIQ